MATRRTGFRLDGKPFNLRPLDSFYMPEPNTGCWIWTGTRHTAGYGVLRRFGQKHPAHRYVYEQMRGPIPEGLFACHTCDEPSCVNPDHIFLGTPADNARDMAAKGRDTYGARTHCKHGHEFTPENTAYRKAGHGRECKTCRRNKLNRWLANRANSGVPNSHKTHCKRGHELAGENLAHRANGERFCRTCDRLRKRVGQRRWHTTLGANV